MKKQIIVAVASLATVASVAGGGKLASDHYDTYQTKQTNTQAQAEKSRAEELVKLQNQVTLYKGAYDHERIECEKGAGAYGVLPTVTKIKTASPVCGKPVLE